MPQFAPGTDVCRTRVLLAAIAEYRVTSVLYDEGWLNEEQGRQYSIEEIYEFGSFRDHSRSSVPDQNTGQNSETTLQVSKEVEFGFREETLRVQAQFGS